MTNRQFQLECQIVHFLLIFLFSMGIPLLDRQLFGYFYFGHYYSMFAIAAVPPFLHFLSKAWEISHTKLQPLIRGLKAIFVLVLVAFLSLVVIAYVPYFSSLFTDTVIYLYYYGNILCYVVGFVWFLSVILNVFRENTVALSIVYLSMEITLLRLTFDLSQFPLPLGFFGEDPVALTFKYVSFSLLFHPISFGMILLAVFYILRKIKLRHSHSAVSLRK